MPLNGTLIPGSSRAIFAGRRIISGIRLTRKGNRIKRKWWPNIRMINVYSEIIGCMLRFRADVEILRDVDRLGGIDRYLMQRNYLHALGDSEVGLRWRDLILSKVDGYRNEQARLFAYRMQQALVNGVINESEQTNKQ